MWQELIKRWKSESPEFWKKIEKYSLILGSGAFSIIGLDKLIDLYCSNKYNLETNYIYLTENYIK